MSRRSELRGEALIRANYRCEWPDCGEQRWLEMSHIIPLGSGGKDESDNVWMLCKPHHDLYDGRSPFRRRELRLLVAELMLWRRTYG